jgi:hypothetical protein
MASPTSVPYFSREALKAVVELADERDRNDPLMSLFPRRLHMGDKVTVRTMTRRPQRVRHTSRDGKGYTVQPGTLSETTYSPAWFKPQAQVKAGDLDAFYAAEAAVGQTDDRSAALVNDADRRIMRLMEPLLADTALERKHAMAGALQGSYTYKVDDLAQTVSYGLTALTAPGTTWTNAASTILANIRAALSEFFELYGLECDTIFYGRKVADDFATNTQIQTLFGGVRVLRPRPTGTAPQPGDGRRAGPRHGRRRRHLVDPGARQVPAHRWRVDDRHLGPDQAGPGSPGVHGRRVVDDLLPDLRDRQRVAQRRDHAAGGRRGRQEPAYPGLRQRHPDIRAPRRGGDLDGGVLVATKAELESALADALARIDSLESAQGAPAAAPVYVLWRASGPVPGGLVSPGWVSQDPPAEALASLPHVHITAAAYAAEDARRFSPWLGAEG